MNDLSEKVVKIKKFYLDKAALHKSDARASMPDKILIDKEIEILCGYLKPGMHLLDVGCANGYTAFRLAEKVRITAKGMDYVDDMIAQANEKLSNWDNLLGSHLSFVVGDVTAMREKENAYDIVLSKRCIINLPSWELQQKALDEMLKPLRSSGLLLLSEAFEGGWKNLNKARAFFNLKEIPQPWHNLYLPEDKVKSHLKKRCRLVEENNFSSVYYLGSRVIQPYLLPEGQEPDYDSPINAFFAKLPAKGDFGTQKLFVFQKN